jgi:single-strand DNA-binding protein
METLLIATGNAVSDPVLRSTKDGVWVASFRFASNHRKFDRTAGEWRDAGETFFANVTCWRGLAENVRASVHKGDPLVVHGRLTVSSYEKDGVQRTNMEIEASTVCHDLSRGSGTFTRLRRTGVIGGGETSASVVPAAEDAAPASDPAEPLGTETEVEEPAA